MNSNLFRYSNRFMAVAAAAVVFASCEKDQFTEKNALDLDLMRLRVQDSIANVVRTAQYRQDIKVMQYQRMIDSLTAIDAGGKVYYSVIPYNGTLGVASSGGRTEGITTAKATAFAGQSKEAAPVAFEATSKNGVYVFPAMYSGEVTIAVEAPGFSTLNYTSNLTPDGPVANGKVVYVGNVVPLFETGTGETAANFTKTARIQGRAWVETNITNGVEETIPDDANYAVTVQIDTERPAFRTRFINEANDEGQGVTQANTGSASTTRSGFIQRFAYEFAERGTANQNVLGRTLVRSGAYAVLSPASMSGLPIKMEFDEFAADRTFFRDDRVVTARHIYGPNVQADVVPNGVTQPTLTFQAVQTAATATVTYTPFAIGTSLRSDLAVTGVTNTAVISSFRPDFGSANTRRRVTTIAGTGDFSPTVAITGTGTGATAEATNGRLTATANGTRTRDAASWDFDNPTGRALPIVGAPTAATANLNVYDFRVTSGGTGYTADATATITYRDVLTIGSATQVSGGSASGISPFIRIINGGSGFVYPSTTSVASTGTANQFTGFLPLVEFPIGGVIPTGVTTPTAAVVIDQTVGAASFIRVISGGAGYTAAPDVRFRYVSGTPFSINSSLSNPQFAIQESTGNLVFNTAVLGFASINNQLQAGTVGTINSTSINFSTGGTAARYVFVPGATFSIQSTSNTAYTFTQSAVSLQVSSNLNPTGTPAGTITAINITGGNFGSLVNTGLANSAGFTTAFRADVTLTMSFPEPTNTLSAATTTLVGAGLNNYVIPTPITVGVGNGTSTLTGGAGTNVPGFSFTSAGFITGSAVQALSEANIVALVNENAYLVVASAPTNTAVAANQQKFAWGVPVYENGVIAGIRMIEGGNGYVVGTPSILRIVPNFYRGITATTQLPSNRNVAVEVDARPVTFTVRRTLTNASVTVTLTNRGAGYAEVPSLVLFDGGLPYNASNSLSRSISSVLRIANTVGSSFPSPSTTGALAFDPAFANISSASIISGAAIGWAIAADGSSVSYNGNDVPGNGTGVHFDEYNTTAGAIKAIFIDRLGETLTEEFANRAKVAGDIVINELGQVARIDITPGRMIPFQTTPAGSFNTAKGWAAFTPLTYNVAPTLNIASPTGTGATAVINPAISTLPGTNPINAGTGLNPVWVDASGLNVGGTVTLPGTTTTTTTPIVTTTVPAFTTITAINPVTGVITTQTTAGTTTTTGGTTSTTTGGGTFVQNSAATRIGFQIRNIAVTNGGSGYQQGNWYHNSGFTGTGTTMIGSNLRAPYTSEAAARQNFRIIGGVNGANGSNSSSGSPFDLNETNGTERNDRFDVFTGNTYVRDIHLGTGHEVE